MRGKWRHGTESWAATNPQFRGGVRVSAPHALYLDKRDEVERYLDVMELLCVDSEPPAKTVDLLTKILKKL
jgi:hypothetical protein